MRWFRRKRPEGELPDPRTAWPAQAVPDDPAAAASRFWGWWSDTLPDISAALGDGTPQRIERDLAAAVAELHPNLQVSLERGQRAVYALVVSGQEDPALRPFTDAWKAAAPPEDAIWEYHDSVPPVPDPTGVTVNLGPRSLALADVRVAARVDEVEGVVDVAVHHPLLGELDAQMRAAMTFLPLEATLGERLAAERLRRVETADREPAGAITLLQLRDLVRGLGEERPESVGGAD